MSLNSFAVFFLRIFFWLKNSIFKNFDFWIFREVFHRLHQLFRQTSIRKVFLIRKHFVWTNSHEITRIHASVIFKVNVLAQDIFFFPSGFLFIIFVYNVLELPKRNLKKSWKGGFHSTLMYIKIIWNTDAIG